MGATLVSISTSIVPGRRRPCTQLALLPLRHDVQVARTVDEKRAAIRRTLKALRWEERAWGIPFAGRYEVEVCRRYLDLLAAQERMARRAGRAPATLQRSPLVATYLDMTDLARVTAERQVP